MEMNSLSNASNDVNNTKLNETELEMKINGKNAKIPTKSQNLLKFELILLQKQNVTGRVLNIKNNQSEIAIPNIGKLSMNFTCDILNRFQEKVLR